MATIKVDQAVRGSRSGRPIMVLLDLLGKRWVLRIIWELRGEPMTFRELRAACSDMSPSVLNQRLADLREGLIVEAVDDGYTLSERGRELSRILRPLHHWADDWAKSLRD